MKIKGNIETVIRELDALRTHPDDPRDVTLRQFLGDESLNQHLSLDVQSVEGMFAALGIDPQLTTVQELRKSADNSWLLSEFVREGIRQGMGLAAREQMAALRRAIVSNAITGEDRGGKPWISPEVFLDPASRGAVQAAFYQDLIIDELTVGQPKVTMPRLNLSEAGMQDTEEAATTEEGTVSYDDKDVTLQEKSIGIKITDNAVRFNKLSLLSIFFRDMGRRLAGKLNNMAVDCLVLGDQDDASEAPMTVGINDTDEGLQYLDMITVWTYMGMINRMANTLLGGAAMSIEYLDLPPVKNKQNTGNALLPTNVKVPLPSSADLYPTARIGANKVLAVDPNVTMVQLTAVPLVGESERIASKGLTGSYFRIYTGFAIAQRDGRVLVDKSLLYSAHPFQDWMLAEDE